MCTARILLLVVAAATAIVGAAEPVGNPMVTGPASGGRGQPFGALSAADLSQSHYTEAEFFFGGTAASYDKDGAWGLDGMWAVKPSRTATYKIRMLVRRPADAARFNGIVVVEWLNVTAMLEGAADFMQMKEEIEREGYAWVGIGAQASGVNAPRTGLKAFDAERYGSLEHPGDAYSYEMFSQGVQAVVHPKGIDPLGGLRIRKTIATGRSQSAFRLVTYINAFHAATRLFDGYLVHSRGANAAGLTAEQLARDSDPIPAGAHIRSDVDAPVLDLQTEGDIVTLRAHTTHQPASGRYRRWEIAGAAHAESPRWVAEVPPPLEMGLGCKEPINTAPHHAVVKAALRALTRWVRDGVAPPQSPAIALVDNADAPDPIVRDAHGNAKGGIRLPELEAPVARLDGQRNDVAQAAGGAPNFCFLFGHTVAFDAETMKALFPSHDAFVTRFNAAADALVRDGYWLKPEGDAAKHAAEQSHVGR
jgi:alpha/beta hydrolase family protein